jgi:hypothetical protein
MFFKTIHKNYFLYLLVLIENAKVKMQKCALFYKILDLPHQAHSIYIFDAVILCI